MPGVLQDIQRFMSAPETASLAENTKIGYRTALNQHVTNYLKFKGYPTNVEHESVDWKGLPEYLKEKYNMTGHSIQKHLQRIRTWYSWSYDRRLKIPFRISNGDMKAYKEKHLRRWFDEQDIAKCLAYRWSDNEILMSNEMSLKYQILVRLMIETGARVGELSRIEGKHVEIEDYMVWLMSSKTQPRAAFFSPSTQIMFKSFQQTTKKWEGRLFPGEERIKQAIAEMLANLGLKSEDDGRGPHTFRHFLATKLFYVGKMRVEDIAFLLGDKVETIVGTYLHPTPMMLRERVSEAMGWEMEI